MKQNIVYMLKCSNQSYYTGWTNDFIKRMKAHQNKTAAHYTRAFTPVEVVYAALFDNKSEAMKQEARIKKMKRKQKEELILAHASLTAEYLSLHPFTFKGE